MTIDLEDQTIADPETLTHHKKEDLRVICSKVSKEEGWVATAYIEEHGRIVVYAVAHGKKYKSVTQEVLCNAIKRMNGETE